MDPLGQKHKVKNGEQTDHEEQDDTGSRGIADFEKVKGVFVNEVDQHIGAVDRSPLGHNLNDVKHLERVDGVDHQQEKEGGRKHGQCQTRQLLPKGGSVQIGRLVNLLSECFVNRR